EAEVARGLRRVDGLRRELGVTLGLPRDGGVYRPPPREPASPARIGAPGGERLARGDDRVHLLLGIANPEPPHENAAAGREPEPRRLVGIGRTREPLSPLSPVTETLRQVAAHGPLGRALAPARGLQHLARALPVLREERGSFVEPVGI